MSRAWPIGGALISSLAALAGSGLILMFQDRAEDAAVWLLSFAIGTLLGAALLGLMPQALQTQPPRDALWLFLLGVLGFIVIERILRWRHPHRPHPGRPHPEVERATAAMILWGDALHNFIDGLVIGVSFDVDLKVGIISSIAILAHELPQEIGDFAILLSSGMNRYRALVLNYLSALTVVPGAVIAFSLPAMRGQFSAVLPLAAGGFVYIALSDLVPAVHHRRGTLAGVCQVFLILCGIAIISVIGMLHGA